MQFTQPQQQQQQYDFSGWGDRLTKIEEGISSLTNQFKNFQNPGNEPLESMGVGQDITGNNPMEIPASEAHQGQLGIDNLGEPLGGLGIHNQEFIDPGVGQFNPPSSAFPDPSAPTDQFGNTIGWNPPPINLFPSQPPGYQPPGVQPGMGTFNHITDNPYAAGPPDNFITIEGVRYYDDGSTQQAPTTPPQQTQPPQPISNKPIDEGKGIYQPGVMPPGWQDVQPFNPNQGIASLADYQTQNTGPGV